MGVPRIENLRKDKIEQKIHLGIETVHARVGPEARSWPEARVILGQRPIPRPPHPARFAPLRGMRGLEIGLWPSILQIIQSQST